MRTWHGWTKASDADAYDRVLRTQILPGIHRIAGYRGCWLLRRAAGEEVEFVTITCWDSWEAIEEFAGKSRTSSVIDPVADRLLKRHDTTSEHFEATWVP
ncbi:MAG TPA: hypothetical protein VG496_06260 [Myxococcales bacterium]|nr:hypothetical protein [Myxococcales bacterium]